MEQCTFDEMKAAFLALLNDKEVQSAFAPTRTDWVTHVTLGVRLSDGGFITKDEFRTLFLDPYLASRNP